MSLPKCRVVMADAAAFTDGAGASSGGRFRPLSKSANVSEPLADAVPAGES